MRRAFEWIFAPALAHGRAWLGVNAAYWGALVLGAVYAGLDPTVQSALLKDVGEAFSPTGSLGPVVQAYLGGRLVAAILLTFVVNLLGGSLLVILLPSLVVPLAGIFVGVLRALLWGVLFSPFVGFDLRLAPHVLTILVEGEAYVVAMLGVWLWWWPVLRGPSGRWRAWLDGLRLQARVYVAVACLLAVAATYEALEVIYVVARSASAG